MMEIITESTTTFFIINKGNQKVELTFLKIILRIKISTKIQVIKTAKVQISK